MVNDIVTEDISYTIIRKVVGEDKPKVLNAVITKKFVEDYKAQFGFSPELQFLQTLVSEMHDEVYREERDRNEGQ